METIEWFYRPSQQRKKSSKIIRIILGIVFHLSFLFFYFRYKLENSSGEMDTQMLIMMGVMYLIGVLAFWLFLNRVLTVRERMYTIIDNILEIKEQNKKSKSLDLAKYDSFSSNIGAYSQDRAASKLTEETFIYLGMSDNKEARKPWFMLEVNNEDLDRVKEALRQRLKEIV